MIVKNSLRMKNFNVNKCFWAKFGINQTDGVWEHAVLQTTDNDDWLADDLLPDHGYSVPKNNGVYGE